MVSRERLSSSSAPVAPQSLSTMPMGQKVHDPLTVNTIDPVISLKMCDLEISENVLYAIFHSVQKSSLVRSFTPRAMD